MMVSVVKIDRDSSASKLVRRQGALVGSTERMEGAEDVDELEGKEDVSSVLRLSVTRRL